MSKFNEVEFHNATSLNGGNQFATGNAITTQSINYPFENTLYLNRELGDTKDKVDNIVNGKTIVPYAGYSVTARQSAYATDYSSGGNIESKFDEISNTINTQYDSPVFTGNPTITRNGTNQPILSVANITNTLNFSITKAYNSTSSQTHHIYYLSSSFHLLDKTLLANGVIPLFCKVSPWLDDGSHNPFFNRMEIILNIKSVGSRTISSTQGYSRWEFSINGIILGDASDEINKWFNSTTNTIYNKPIKCDMAFLYY